MRLSKNILLLLSYTKDNDSTFNAPNLCYNTVYSFFHCIIDFRTFAADLSPNNQVFAPGVKFMMGNGESVPYDPLTFYHGVLVGQLTLSCTAIIIVLITSMCIQIKKKIIYTVAT